MPIPVPDAIDEAASNAAAKVAQLASPGRYLAAAVQAGAYVGVAVVLLLSVTGPLAAAGSPATRLVQGAVFGIALTLVVFAGGELFTGNVMVMLQGVARRSVRVPDLARVWVVSLVGNVVGSVLLAALVHGAGTLQMGAVDGRPGPAQALLAGAVRAKESASGPQLFWRAVLCNALVCLGLWMAARTRSDVAKLIVVSWALLAFVASGFEHSVANVTIFSLGILSGEAGVGDLLWNLAWTVPGNTVGGGLLVALAYVWTSGAGQPADVPQSGTVDARDLVVGRG